MCVELGRFEQHAHTWDSNIRLLDCIIKPTALVDRALELGLSGIAITDHEALCAHIEVNKRAQEIQKEHPEFKVALGNEIYLTQTRDKGQKYYHFILIAKNKTGYKALRELSSEAWLKSYYDRGLERVPTLYSELEDIVAKYPNSLIATSACLGGELSSEILKLIKAEENHNRAEQIIAHDNIVRFVLFCHNLFGEDFYIEVAPAANETQIAVNKRLKSIADCFNIKMSIGCDAHFLKKEDRFVHKAYLNSKNGEREVDTFYEYCYLQSEEEIIKNLKPSGLDYEELKRNSIEIYNKIENFSLFHKQQIPSVEVKDYLPIYYDKNETFKNKYPTLTKLYQSDDKYDRYWVNECVASLCDKIERFAPLNSPYMERLEEEARVKSIIGEKLETNMFKYPITLQHYADLFWECGSTVGAGRGSSCSGLNHYLLGITQLDPLKWNLPFWRYLNEDRTELGDIDIDICPSKRPTILKKIKAERGENFAPEINPVSRKNLGCTLVATFSTESTKSAILTACRGYRSEEFPNGIDVDIAKYISSLVPIERGFVWSFHDIIFGDPDKGRKPVKEFIKEVEKYPRLLEIMLGIEGIVKSRGSHASGVILFDEDPYEFGCFMRTKSGDVVTQWDLHDAEYAG